MLDFRAAGALSTNILCNNGTTAGELIMEGGTLEKSPLRHGGDKQFAAGDESAWNRSVAVDGGTT
ncbi:MAG TPA: hypothetical protein VHX86_11375 [Tepidisphaeraceae bacterium]|jgi:hypothetical protein|nr:hypothetical protein [Tepidisphaeraceae bacterium]